MGVFSAVVFAMSTAAAEHPPHCLRAGDATWQPQAVRWPVAPDAVEPTAPWVSSSVADHSDPVTVTTSRAAALWIPAATVVRVRVVRGQAGDVRLARVGGTHAAKIVAHVMGVPTPGGIDLVEPVGPGSMWVITAVVPTTIAVERVDQRDPRLAWEAARDALYAWIDRDDHSELPELPWNDGGGAAIRLLGARALLAGNMPPAVRSAIQLWRRTQADSIVAALRPGDDPYVAHQTFVPDGPPTSDAREELYGPSPGPGQPWRLRLQGPGVLVVDARATAAQTVAGGLAMVTVRRNGVVIAQAGNAVASTVVFEPGASLPGSAADADAATADDPLGRKIRATVPLALGTHVYEITVAGAGLVRADVRRRKSRLREWLFDRSSSRQYREAKWIAAKLALVGDFTARSVGEWLIASALGELPSRDHRATTPAALFAQLVAMPGQIDPEPARALIAKITALVQRERGHLEHAIVLALAERLPDGADATPIARALFAPGHPEPPAALLTALAPHLPRGERSDGLAAAELAWRQHPTVSAFRSALLAVARQTPLHRVDPDSASMDRADAVRWLSARPDGPAAATDPTARFSLGMSAEPEGSGAGLPEVVAGVGTRSRIEVSVAELALGRDAELDVAPHPDDDKRLAVVRVYVATPPDAPGPVRVGFDGGSQMLVALRSLEVLELAAAPGRHAVRVDGPSGTRAFVAAPRPATGSAAGAAVVIKRWPVDATVVYNLPTPRAVGPVRIELVGRFVKRPSRHVVWLHSETGPPRRLILNVREPDPASWPIDDDRAYAPPAALWVWLPPSTRRFWLSSDDGPLYARVSVHGPAKPPLPAAPGPEAVPLPRIVGLEQVAELSSSIAAQGDIAQHYVARAMALLELGEVGAARRDLATAAPRLRDEDRPVYDDANAQFDALAQPSYLPLQPPDSPIRSGVSIGTPSIAPEPELVLLARRVRRLGAAAVWAAMKRGDVAIPSSASGKSVTATLASHAGQPRVAVDRWLEVGSWQARVAALLELRTLLDRGTRAVAPLGVGIAEELDDVVLPSVRHARAVAARASRWEPVRHTSRNAGFESLATIPTQIDEAPAVALRRALLGAPWRDAPTVLEPGRTTIMPVDGPKTVDVQVWCRRLWPADLTAECRLTSVLDQSPPRSVVVRHGRVHSIAIDVPDGHHEIEVGLTAEDPTAVAAVRFVDAHSAQASAMPLVRRTRVFLADADRPAEIVVSGPGAVAVEVRGYTGHADLAHIAVIGSRAERRVAVGIDNAPAPETTAAPGRDVSVTRPVTRTVLLATRRPYTIRVTPSRDTVAVRFATRVTTTSSLDVSVDPTVDVASAGLAWPASIPWLTLEAGREQRPRWIPSIEGVVGQDSLEALDSDFAELDLRYELAMQLRRRGRNVSWFAELRGRRAGPLGPTSRLRAVGEFRGLPLGLETSFDARAAAQTTSAGTLWLVRGAGNVSRPLQVSSRWRLVPEIALYAAALGPADVPFGADPMVASSYRRNHPLQLAESLDLTGRLWADQHVSIGLNMRSNDSPVALDAVGARVMWRGLVETSPRRGGIIMLEYAPTLRFADEHREYAFLRHDLAAELRWPWPIAGGRYGRIAMALRGDLYPPTNVSQMAHAVTLRLRWDGWHPGERSHMPFEEPLSDFVDEVSWAGPR